MMPSQTPARSWVVRLAPLLGVIGLMLSGCGDPVADDAPAEVTPPTAEERYERIVEILRQSVGGRTASDVSAVKDFNATPGVPVTDGRLRLEEELSPPTKAGEPYQAVICLSTRSTVTIVLPQSTESDKQEDRAETQSRIEDAKTGFEDVPGIESLVIPKTEGLRRSLSRSPIHEIEADESKSCFPLEFRDGRWELINEIDPDEEPLFSLSIEYALKMQ